MKQRTRFGLVPALLVSSLAAACVSSDNDDPEKKPPVEKLTAQPVALRLVPVDLGPGKLLMLDARLFGIGGAQTEAFSSDGPSAAR
jgi:hypothetical protein